VHTWPHKDPNEVLDYRVDWTARLESGETITTSTVSRPTGDVVIDSQSYLGAMVTVWLSGGTDDTMNILTSRIVTNQGRTYDESVKLRVRTK
jgi:hypothetical protein